MRRLLRSIAASPAYRPETGEKISSVSGSIAAIIPLQSGVRTTRALLFSLVSRLLSQARPFSVLRPSPERCSHGRRWKMSDATDSFIAAWRAVPDRASAVPDRCHRSGQLAVRRRISDSTRARPEGVLGRFPLRPPVTGFAGTTTQALRQIITTAVKRRRRCSSAPTNVSARSSDR